MKQFFGSSQRGDLKEAVRGLQNPQLILLMSIKSSSKHMYRNWKDSIPVSQASDALA